MHDPNPTRFWMLKAQNGGSPTAVHSNLATARLRAEALARQLRTPVFLLEAVEVAVPDLPPDQELPVRWTGLADRGVTR